jgi:glycolate oxidase FAD binding subunit
MAEILRPNDAKDVEVLVRDLIASGRTAEVVGRGSKRGIGRPLRTDVTLDLSALTGVTLYEPQELVLSARAGTPLAEIEALLAAHNQELAFEPMDFGRLFSLPAEQATTIGGIIAANVSGPRRIKAGAARDHFLGFTAVSGRADTFKSGGRVVKNVTGYDLCKLLAGSWGTLAVMTDVTVKVLPRAETEATLLIYGLDDVRAVAAMTAATGSSCDLSGAAHAPALVAARMRAVDRRAVTALRIEGVAPSVAHRLETLRGLMNPFGELATLDEAASRLFWRAIRDAVPLAGQPTVLWRISAIPARGADLVAAVAASAEAEALYDWAGGLIWLSLPTSKDGGAALLRRATERFGGHATLVRAPAALRETTDVFAPEPGALAALTRRVKDSFDPKRVLNPGRMWANV